MSKVVDQFQAVISALRKSARLRSTPDRAVVDAAPRVLAVMGEGPGRDALQVVFRDAGWEMVVADTSASAIARQEKEPLPIILKSEVDLHVARKSLRQKRDGSKHLGQIGSAGNHCSALWRANDSA